jgi:hypothetical protein
MADSTPRATPVEVSKVEIGLMDAKTSSNFQNCNSATPRGLRGKITKLSNASRSRLISAARNRIRFHGMVTLTYPDASYSLDGCDFMGDGRMVKEHLRRFRQWLTYRDIAGLWFLEFQKRGAPHYHFFLSRPLSDQEAKKARAYWFKLVGSGNPDHLIRGCKSETLRKPYAAGMYAAKYSSKHEQKEVPEAYQEVGRFWGTFGIDSETLYIQAEGGIKEVAQVARVARNAEKAARRSRGVPRRKRQRHSSGTQYDAALAVRAYLSRFYTIPDSPSKIVLSALRSCSPGSIPLTPVDT